MERDELWLAQERQRLSTEWSRNDLIDWLLWVDPNGTWTDEDMTANGMEPMSLKDAVEQVMMFVEENRETPEEMTAAANPGRR